MANGGEVKADPTERIAAALERIAVCLETMIHSDDNLEPAILVSVKELWDSTTTGGGTKGDECALRVHVVATPDS
jgi:hypothetical protein